MPNDDRNRLTPQFAKYMNLGVASVPIALLALAKLSAAP